MAVPAKDVAVLLDELGLAIGERQVEIVDFKQAESGYIHHSRVPVALVGYTCVSPIFARGRFPKFTFLNLIQKRPAMDGIEARSLAAICGLPPTPFGANNQLFGKQLWNVISLYQLDELFERVERWGSVGDHYLMRPRGFEWTDPDQPELSGGLAKWRSVYKKLSPVQQLMAATVLQLYRQGDDPYWMVRVPKKWHASEGIEILRGSDDAFQDWGLLYSLYPGW